MFKSKPLLCAVLINTVWIILALVFCDTKYEISDDFVIASILSGGYGALTAYAPYVNVFLNKILKVFYMVFPAISWFFIYQIVLGALSFVSIIYVVLNKNGLRQGGFLSLLVLLFFADDIYVLPSYTKTAALAVIAGGVLILYALWEAEKHVGIQWITGSLLLIGGGLLRKESLILSMPFLGFFFIEAVIHSARTHCSINAGTFRTLINSIKLPVVLQKLGLCMVPILIVVCAVMVYNYQWNKTESRALYNSYNELRSAVTDTAGYGYDSVKDQFMEMNLDETDYKMINSWNFMDMDIYSADVLTRIADIKKAVRDKEAHNSSSILQRALSRNSFGYWPAIGVLIFFVLASFSGRRNVVYLLFLWMLTIILMLYFYWINRTVYRVEYGIFFGTAMGFLFGGYEEDADSRYLRNGFCIITIFLVLFHSLIYIPDKNYQDMTDSEYRSYRSEVFTGSGLFKPIKYWSNTNQRQAYPHLTERIRSDEKYYYLFDFNTTIQLTYYDYKPWEATPVGFYERFSYLGGITNYYPGNQAQWKKQGIDPENPYKSIVNDNILVVDSKNHEAKLNYLKKYYYPNARKEKVATVDGFQIWKYYKE